MKVVTKKDWIRKYFNFGNKVNGKLLKSIFGKYPRIVRPKNKAYSLSIVKKFYVLNDLRLRKPPYYDRLIEKYSEISKDSNVQQQILEYLQSLRK